MNPWPLWRVSPQAIFSLCMASHIVSVAKDDVISPPIHYVSTYAGTILPHKSKTAHILSIPFTVGRY